MVLYISLTLRALGVSCMQFLIGCAHLRKQPLFQGACETAFEKCRDPETSDISRGKLADVLRLSMLLPSDDGVSLHCPSATNAQPCVAIKTSYSSENTNLWQMLKLFKTFDVDGDEKISRDDFITCLGRFPFLIAFFAAPINGEVYIEIVWTCDAVACKSKRAGAARRRQGDPSVYAMGHPLRLLHFETKTQTNLVLRLHQVANQYSAKVLFRFFVELLFLLQNPPARYALTLLMVVEHR